MAELEGITERDGSNLDTFSNAVGWYKVLYRDIRWDIYILHFSGFVTDFHFFVCCRHALHFWSMVEQRMAGSHSLLPTSNPPFLPPVGKKWKEGSFKEGKSGSETGWWHAWFTCHSRLCWDDPQCYSKLYILWAMGERLPHQCVGCVWWVAIVICAFNVFSCNHVIVDDAYYYMFLCLPII